MTQGNLRSTLRARRRCGSAMGDYDRLPVPLRLWLARALLPWSVSSAQRVWRKARGDAATALRLLDHLEQQRIAQDAARIWGASHPGVADR